jgi:hypothetical protein
VSPQVSLYARYRDFLDVDARRRGDALEFGHDWRGPGGRYRVCWYQETGELTAERLSETQALDLEDFHRGIEGPVFVLARIPSRAQLDRLLGAWPQVALESPRTIARLRGLIAARPQLRPVPER